MNLPSLRLKKDEERRLRAGHVWIYSNEIDTKATPLKNFTAGETVRVETYDRKPIGCAYINPHSLITARLLSTNPTEMFTTEFIATRIQSALQWRERFFNKPFYRLVFGESDQLPGLVIDRFGSHLVVQLNTAGMEAKKENVIAAILSVVPNTESILFRNDSGTRLSENLPSYVEAGYGTAPERVLLEENGTQFYAPLMQGQKTGWFYDHRLNRSRLKDYVHDKRVLDVFSYLGGWGIQAAMFGAKEVYCLDVSSDAIKQIPDNAALNHVEDKVHVLCDDAFDGLKKLQHANEKFDIIILDPPAFIKKQKDKKEGTLAYQRINEAALKLLQPGGILFSCSCSMHLDYDALVQAIRRASLQAGCQVQIVERGHQGPDHPVHLAIPETDYLKMVVVRKMDLA